MMRRRQLSLVFHGAFFMLVAMSTGTPGFYIAIHQNLEDPTRMYFRQTHSILIATGIWMIATGGVLPLLKLADRGLSVLVYSLIASGYTFLIALGVLGFGVLGIASILNPPTTQAPLWDQLTNAPCYLGYVYIVLVSVSGLLSFIAIAAIVYGAYKAKRLSPLDAIH